MHETIIAKDIIEAAQKQGKVKAITVEVGDLGHLPIEEMEATLKKMVEWDVKMLRKPGKVKCECGFEGEPKIVEKQHGHTMFVCPECGAIPDVLEGEDIILKEVTVE